MKRSGKRFLTFFLMAVMFAGAFVPQRAMAATVRLSRLNLELYTGYSAPLELKNAENVKWSTSDKDVAKVSEKGVVTAVDAGSCSIKAYDRDTKKSYTCSVKVRRKALSLDSSMGTVKKEGTFFTLATLKNYIKSELGDNIGSDVSWVSSDESIVCVTEDQGLCAFDYGTVTLSAQMRGRTYYYDLSIVEADESKKKDKEKE